MNIVENPGDGCYFHQESNDKRMKANDDQDGLLPRLVFVVAMERAILNGSELLVQGTINCFFNKLFLILPGCRFKPYRLGVCDVSK